MNKYIYFFLIFIIPLPLISQEKVDYFEKLNSKERDVIVNKGTEYPNTGKYNKHFKDGLYHCKACDSPLYTSSSKFESNCGWPSFDDEIKGAIKRIPSKNSILSNLSQGGKAFKTILNSRELNISNHVAKKLKKQNIFFAGIDLVSNYLIGDINVTSPTGLKNHYDLTGINLAVVFWNTLEKLK